MSVDVMRGATVVYLGGEARTKAGRQINKNKYISTHSHRLPLLKMNDLPTHEHIHSRHQFVKHCPHKETSNIHTHTDTFESYINTTNPMYVLYIYIDIYTYFCKKNDYGRTLFLYISSPFFGRF